MYFSIEKELSADTTATGNVKIIIRAIQSSKYVDKIAA